jgi:hypothetical protein
MSRNKIILGSIACVIILGIAIGVGVYFGTRPDNIEVTTSTATETLPTVIKAAKIEESANGVVTIEYTNLLSDRSVVSYYLNIENFNFAELSLAEANLENLAIYLTRSAEPTVDNLGNDAISIPNIAGQEVPYRLQDGFVPGDYNGVLFGVEDNSITTVSSLEFVASSEFSLIVNPDQNIASPTAAPTPSPSASPTIAPTPSPSASPTIAPAAPTPTPSATPSGAPTISPAPSSGTKTPTASPSDTPSFEPTSSFSPTIDPTKSPTKSPTRAPTPAPTKSPTRAPTPAPTGAPLPPALTASLSGEYQIGGTLTIDYRNDLVNGQVQSVPILEFDIPRLASAPGPFLYLSKRPYSETRRGRLTNDEIFIPIDSADGGSFSVQGNFEQVLDEIGNVQDLSDYQNGSWVVWCRPFSVWIGGGPIEIV